jgi:hypothetical protein
MQEGGPGEQTPLRVGVRGRVRRWAHCVGQEASGGDAMSEVHHHGLQHVSAR